MADTGITLFYNTHRVDAMSHVLWERGTDIEHALAPALDALYEQLVPADQREEIERLIEAERIQAETEWESARRFAVIHFHAAEDDYFFTSEHCNSFYQVASRYRKISCDDTADLTSQEIAELYFITHNPIDPYTFSAFCDTAQKDERVTALIQLDFKGGSISVKERSDNEWRTYRLKDVSTAVWKAERRYDLTLPARCEIFDAALEGKETGFDSELKSFGEESGAPTIQL